MEIKKNTTFWSALNDYKICIPDYQRDYAQGRKDGGRVDNIREVFVKQLFEACTEEKNSICHLGLVFGSYDKNKNTFIAVDGQQRLTTVYLLHWYLLWKTGKLNCEKYKPVMSNFIWNTRSYSAQFANLLINLGANSDNRVIPEIKKNKDYFIVWEKDPSVKAMMNTLEEIEKQYISSYKSSVNVELLFSEDCRIKYDILPLSSNSDGKTYLKMNSRGRSLTTYENFKAKFQDVVSGFYPLLDLDALSQSFDGKWLNFMLKQSQDSTAGSFSDPDIPFMYFINEFTIGRLCVKGKGDEIEPFVKAKIDKNGNLRDVPFVGFESYKPVFENIKDINTFKNSLDWIIDNFTTIATIDNDYRYGDDFFVSNILGHRPDYGDRAKFYALLKYAALSEYKTINAEDVNFRRWCHVFTNLIENTVIGKDNLNKIILSIDSVSNPDIVSVLDSSNLPAFNSEQLLEEKQKMHKISEQDRDWENYITQVEHDLFFKGAIRFLFRNEDNKLSWNEFETKLNNTRQYFSKEGVCDYNNTEYKSKALLLKAVLYHAKDYWNLIEPQKFVLDNKADTWRNNILLNSAWAKAVHKILTGNLEVTEREGDPLLYKTLYSSSLIEYVANHLPGSRIRWIHGHRAIYQPYYEGILPDDDNNGMNFYRNHLLSKFYEKKTEDKKNDKKIYSDSKIEGCDAFFGWDIDFEFNGRLFKWNSDKYAIYLMEQKDIYYTPEISIPERELTESNFLDKLNSMLELAKKEHQ